MPFNKFVERDFPHIVEIIVPKTGKSGKLDAMNDFHVRHTIKPHRTHGRYKDGALVSEKSKNAFRTSLKPMCR
jgi:hypothetical protein